MRNIFICVFFIWIVPLSQIISTNKHWKVSEFNAKFSTQKKIKLNQICLWYRAIFFFCIFCIVNGGTVLTDYRVNNMCVCVVCYSSPLMLATINTLPMRELTFFKKFFNILFFSWLNINTYNNNLIYINVNADLQYNKNCFILITFLKWK